GEKLLVEKYAIALSPGLQLLEPAPLTERSRNLLEAGVSEARTISGRTFGQLSYVPVELEQIQAIIPNTHALLNDTFVIANLQEQIESTPFSVVHVATHGNFSSNPDDTFILLWDSLLKARQFDQLLQSRNPEQDRPIDLLTLSACQTATGDERATLGLAGIAVRSGTRSTLATLWRVEDVSTADFMVRFYQELWNDLKLTKAEALRRAQLHLLKEHPNTNYRLPYYWAPFVLVGNWQ
ncbi:MAG TPA: CHAT domain-containing protein, partial [Allocoleopsis sp.]